MTKLGSRKLHIFPEVTKMGSIICHRIDYNGVGANTQHKLKKKKRNELNLPIMHSVLCVPSSVVLERFKMVLRSCVDL